MLMGGDIIVNIKHLFTFVHGREGECVAVVFQTTTYTLHRHSKLIIFINISNLNIF